jgi:hypothetical protein
VGAGYYAKLAAGATLDSVLQYGVHTEESYWGLAATGVYSNADLVANYEGMRFYQSLTQDNVIPGKKAIVGWDNDLPRVQRTFDVADHVSDYWSEALNPSTFSDHLEPVVNDSLKRMCFQHQGTDFSAYVSRHDSELASRYAHLHFSSGHEKYRLDNFCKAYENVSPADRQAFVAKVDGDRKGKELPPKRGMDVSREELASLPPQTIGANFVAGCEDHKKKALEEHDALVKWYNQSSPAAYAALEAIARDLQSGSAKHYTLGHTFRAVKGSDGSVEVCATADVPAAKRDSTSTFVRLCVQKPNGGASQRTAQYTVRYDSAAWKNFMDAVSSLEGIIDRGLIANLVNDTYEYVSVGHGYCDFNDPICYVYRTIPPVCRWY